MRDALFASASLKPLPIHASPEEMRRSLASRLPAAIHYLLAEAMFMASGCSHVSTPARATAPHRAGGHADLVARIDALVARTVANPDAPVVGVAIAVDWHGETVLAKGYGLADIEQGHAVAPDSIFRIGSVTKEFTAAAIMKLVASGKVALEDEITKYLPDYPTRGKKITIRQLLTHTSGVKSYTELPWFVERMAAPMSHAELVAKFAAEPLDFEPGTRWHYSNSGYYLLGLVIENASGQSYADYLKASILGPAGLAHTAYCPDAQDYASAARGYQFKAGKADPAVSQSMAHPFAAGGLCSTAADLVAWSRALATYRIVDEAAWQQMTTPVHLADGTPFPYGFGMFLGSLSDHPSISHVGIIDGFSSALSSYPADDLYIAVLLNTQSTLAEQLSVQIARAAFGLPEPEVKDVPISASDAAAIVGTYQFASIGISFEVFLENGVVMTRNVGSSRGARLRSQGNGTYLVLETNAKIVFEFEGAKVIKMLVEQGGIKLEGTRSP